MDSNQLAPAQLAARLDINRSNLTHLFSGRNQPSLDLIKKILHAFPEINTEWLIMGVGPMKKSDNGETETIKQRDVLIEPNLFSSIQEIEISKISKSETNTQRKKNIDSLTLQELDNPLTITDKSQKNDSHEVKITEKIVFFYNDKTFDVYYLSSPISTK